MTTNEIENNKTLQTETRDPGGYIVAGHNLRHTWFYDVLLVGVLIIGALFRFTGVNWDENQHLHPDERFLTMVLTSVAPVNSLAEYFNTSLSTLNPNNRGYGFYVYGSLPLFIVRYVGEWLRKTGYDQIYIVGRQLSAIMDLGTVFVVYLIASRLYKRWVALLAAAFAALMVLPIQLSHYATVDTFTNFFGMLAFFFVVNVLPRNWAKQGSPEPGVTQTSTEGSLKIWARGLVSEWKSVVYPLLFGMALGMAMASKINAGLLAILLPAAALLDYFNRPLTERERWVGVHLRNLVLAGLVTIVVFRIFQPYAFSGPGFLDVKPNPIWVDSIRALAVQSTGDVDFPPALQWARRPIWFSLQNMVLWGLGLPLGILAWGGFLWMGYRIIKAGERQHWLIWAWTGVNFAYQSYNFTRSMRYQMLIYPTLGIIAAWAVGALWERSTGGKKLGWRWLSIAVGAAVLGMTFAWAYAFTQIYVRPMTRVEASRWIYQNVPGPINLRIKKGTETVNQPVSFRMGYAIRNADGPVVLAFQPREAGKLVNLQFEHLVNPGQDGAVRNFTVAISDSPDRNALAVAQLSDTFSVEGDPRGKSYNLTFNNGVFLEPQKTYYLFISVESSATSINMAGSVLVEIFNGREMYRQLLPEPVEALKLGEVFMNTVTAVESGLVDEIILNRVVDWEARKDQKTLRISLLDADSGSTFLASAEVRGPYLPEGDPRGKEVVFRFAKPVEVQSQHRYTIRLEHIDGAGALAVYGSKQANESSWDDALPVSLDGYNAYDYLYGIYRSDLNFEMYWDDNQEKLDRFVNTLDQADVIFISSNRQWGTTTRLPERYPLTSEYYRRLLGCPVEKEITWCYSVAEPGMFSGDLGFELLKVFQSDPNLGGLRFNTQFAEEAFTVYDHPKVLIFKKTGAYRSERVAAILGAVDLTTVVHVTPRKAASYPANLMLPVDRLAQQQTGGTWARLFNTQALINRNPIVTVIVWYLVISALGWVLYPFTRVVLGSLADRGYPQTRLVGMLALALAVWWLGSYQVPFEPITISLVFCVLVVGNLFLAVKTRQALATELRRNWKYYLWIEVLTLAFFLVFLAVRWGNPDLWHPWKGGEKPMDFSYFNAALKSASFPTYDPWFAGGYINYYYYGFVLVGVPVKWLGIAPAVAYNLILPTLFSALAMGAFSIGWNLISGARRLSHTMGRLSRDIYQFSGAGRWLAGLGSAAAVSVIGNWGSVRMIWRGLQLLANGQAASEGVSFLVRISWALKGLVRLISVSGTRLPYGRGDWYWIPSRAYPGEPITEFPAFTFLYADLHAHMIALPITLLALSWALAVLLRRWNWKSWGQLAGSLFFGGLVIGALRPTNTWDWPTYLGLAGLALAYTAIRYGAASPLKFPGVKNPIGKRVLLIGLSLAGLYVIATALYQPFSNWYGQGYNQIDLWKGDRTPFWSYLTHWGVFLFLIVSWLVVETVDWMAATPVSALNRLRKYRELLLLSGVFVLVIIIGLTVIGVQISAIALLIVLWAGILLLRPGQPDAKRMVLVMIGAGLCLTLFVELAVLRGDIGRMNTVFKFSLQAWSLLGLSAGASLFWAASALRQTSVAAVSHAWGVAASLLIFGAFLFPILAGMDKITDRMTERAAHTLDGMAYMQVSTYQEGETVMDLSEDYRAIRWVQENIPGSPVIVEANTPEYRWGNRFTIYTGLPSVVGWNWHQRQQRAITPGEWVFNRVNEIAMFYNTNQLQDAQAFLARYKVKYIIVGQLERALYIRPGLQKFEEQNGKLWTEVYRDEQTAVYQVIQ